MKTVNNTQQLFGSEVSSSKGEAQSRGLFENVKPHLVEEQTLFEAEQVWKKRLGMLVAAENNLIKVIERSIENNITAILSINTNMKDFEAHYKLLENYKSIFIFFGFC